MYLDRQITRSELDNLNENWLTQHGIKLDIPTLFGIKNTIIAPRITPKKEEAFTKPKVCVVQRDEKTGERETWSQIAEKHNLTPLELLHLNYSYNEDPMLLMIGHSLNVEKPKPIKEKEFISEFPPIEVATVNLPLNSYYKYSEHLINGTTVKAINSDKIVAKDIPILRLKINILQSKQLSQSEKLEAIAQGKKAVIKKGVKGDEVKFIQEALLEMKFNLGNAGADGDFGTKAHNAITNFQTNFIPTHEVQANYEIKEADGIVGKNTLPPSVRIVAMMTLMSSHNYLKG